MTDTIPSEGHRLSQRGLMNLNALALQSDLRERIKGEARFDAGTRAIYAHDSSNYRQVPFGVVIPRNEDDVVAAVEVCHRHGANVLPRGCGTSLSGETTNVAVILDTSKYMREILEVNPNEGYAWVQPGVIRDQLSLMTEERYDLTFAPDTSTHAYATFGGMIGNNSCGVHSVMAGRTADNVEELDIVLYDGTRMTVGPTSEEELQRIIAAGGRKGEIYRKLKELRDRYAELIRARYPRIPRRVSGYNLDELLPERGFNVARAIVGSEGTLATVLRAKVRLVYSPPARSLLVLGYPSVYEAGDHVPEVLKHGPVGLEGLDEELLRDMKLRGMHPNDIPLLPGGKGWLLAEFGGATTEESHRKAREAMQELEKADNPPDMQLFESADETERIWGIREDGLGATAYVPLEDDHWPGWEDSAVAPEKVGDYLRDLRSLYDKYNYHASIYGHFGDGCIHCRVDFDLKTADGLKRWESFMNEAADLVVSYGGSLSGEHGDGQQRAQFLPKMYGEELMQAFREFKEIWDPDWRMNPGKVIDANPMLSNLRFGTDYAPTEPEHLYFSYPDDHNSFAHATMRCVGAGKCRDIESGTMCPSYMVTLEEEHNTRGRARILHEMLRGEVVKGGFKSDEVFDALDLCLSCKGCKGDCPVNVDMATYKAEFLSRYYRGRLRPRHAYAMGLIMFHARLAQFVPRLANAVTHAPVLGDLLKKAAGLATEREMPPFATQTFKGWFEERGGARHPGGPPVVLFPDTFNNFLHPEDAKATVEVLEHAGYHVIVPEQPLCCGRPLYDYGMLDTARAFLERLVEALAPYVREGVPVVGIEPSCVAVFRDELPNMLPHDEDAKRLSQKTLTLAEFLVGEAAEGYEPPKLERKAIVHGHCHQKAVMGMSAEQKLLEKMELDFEVLDSGCCGLAGSFGFEAEHYEVSMRVGERRLLPAARKADKDTLVVADGFSCKTQIEHATDRRGMHIAQVIKMALDHGESGPEGVYPEHAYPDVALDGTLKIPKAALAGAALAGGAAIAWSLNRRR